ncbi:MAG: type I-U CRISPR-associated protein Cas5/Cas6 [Caulobacteraceae bacterium]|nr:type I-U CRISPR-associated protein Cas5/Cas6 [Caulobacteraceae bacterium]
MSDRALLIEVRWPDGRFHGVREGRERGRGAEAVVREWPPSPFRLFQALVAGAYGGRWAFEARAEKDAAFAWLERLDPPVILAPAGKTLRPVTYYVPNNDADAVGGDPGRVNEIRSARTLRASMFESERPAAYLWTFDGDDAPARRMAQLAGRLHTLGHGIDAAFARAEVLDVHEGEQRLLALGGTPRRPAIRPVSGERGTPCPASGSFDSLRRRHEAFIGRFTRAGAGRKAVIAFRQPSKAHARAICYDQPSARLLYELTPLRGRAQFRPWPLINATLLTVMVRDQAARALRSEWPREVERYVIGRGAGPGDVTARLRILPLPSIGTRHTSQDIRRMLVDVPPDHPVPIADLKWALSGRELADGQGEPTGIVLSPASDTSMLGRYRANVAHGEGRVWRTVTPAALPGRRGRGRGGDARAAAEAQAAGSVVQALRHAGITTPVSAVRVQKEPFDLKGECADRFMPDRFNVHDLHHVEITFGRPVGGPLVLGDGRWLGLGVMRPVSGGVVRARAGTDGLHVLSFNAGPALGARDAEAITRALRRAVMARAQLVAGTRLKRGENLPVFFTGHVETTAPARRTQPAKSGLHEHLFFAFDPNRETPRLLVIAPHRVDRNREVLDRTRRQLSWLAEAVEGLDDLRAGALGRFSLALVSPEGADPIFGRSKAWVSLTAYRPTRHPRGQQDAAEALIVDLIHEASRRNLPRPEVDVLAVKTGPRGGIQADLQLRFAVAVNGPLLLGQDSHFGAGLFGRN